MGKISSEEFLAHYGIKGQKHGVRRFQYENRRWTPEGKIRYGRNAEGRKASHEKYGGNTSKSSSKKSDDLHKKKGGVDWETVIPMLTPLASGGATAGIISSIASTYSVPLDIAAKAFFTANPQIGLMLGLTTATSAAIAGMAVKSHYDRKKYDKERENNPIDEKTGFHKKSENMSIEDDLKRVNPEHNNFNTNTKSNCMLCTSAYEMRRRGYDVRAEKAAIGFDETDVKKWFPKAKVVDVLNDKPSQGFYDSKYASKVIENIVQASPEGARGNLLLTFGAMSNYAGRHSVAYEVKNGKLMILDAQINSKYEGSEVKNLLQNCSNVKYARLDNVAFDLKEIKECCS